MPKTTKSEKVPSELQGIYDEIVVMTDEFCKCHLNNEYAQLARYATAALCRKRPSPLMHGKTKSWACGIVYALGFVNFLFDKSQEIHISASELCKKFGLSASTGSAKAKAVRDVLGMIQLDPNWCLPSNLDNNPMVWMIMVNGMIADARHLPRDLQEVAYEKGLIPYIPADKKCVG